MCGLQTLLAHFGVDVKISRLEQILFLLQKTQLVGCHHYGDNPYYVPNKFRKIYVDYTGKEKNQKFQRERFKARVWREIQSDNFRKNVFEIASKGKHK